MVQGAIGLEHAGNSSSCERSRCERRRIVCFGRGDAVRTGTSVVVVVDTPRAARGAPRPVSGVREWMGRGGRVSDKGRGAGTCLHPGISRPSFGVLSPVARALLRHFTQCKAGFSQSIDSVFQRVNVFTHFTVVPPGRAPRRKENQTWWCPNIYRVTVGRYTRPTQRDTSNAPVPFLTLRGWCVARSPVEPLATE